MMVISCLRLLDEIQMLELFSENGRAVAAEPVVQQRGIHPAEIGVIAQVAGIEVFQTRMRPDQTALDRRARDKQTRAGAVVRPLAAVLLHATAKLGKRHQHDALILALLLQRLEERTNGVAEFLHQLAM